MSATQEAALDNIKLRLEESHDLAKTTGKEIQTINASMNYIQNLGTEMLSFLQRIWKVNIQIYSALLAIQSNLPVHLERTWTQEPVRLKDALGRTTSVHLEFVETWEVSTSVICDSCSANIDDVASGIPIRARDSIPSIARTP